MAHGNRRLFFHGFIFFALAPFFGFAIMAPVPNPRAMMSLHVAMWLSGAVLCAAAAAWPHLALRPRTVKLAEHGVVFGFWQGFLLGLVQTLGNAKSMFAGGSDHAPVWATVALMVFQLGITVTLVPGLIAVAVGLGRKPRPAA